MTAGATYYFYVNDTSNGTAALPNPLSVTLHETGCPAGVLGDVCPEVGDTRCRGNTTLSATPAAAIQDNGGNATTCSSIVNRVTSTLAMAETGLIDDVDVSVAITHTYDSEMDIFLGYVAGGVSRCVELTTDNGSSSDNFTGTVFDDEAATAITAGTAPFTGSFRPEVLLSTFDGMEANGTWTLYVSDDGSGDTGTLDAWGLDITRRGGSIIDTCSVAASGCLEWAAGVDCSATGDFCNAGSGTAQCLTCQDTCLLEDDTRCADEVIETCTLQPSGCVDWVAGTDCSLTGEFCDPTAPVSVCVLCFDECDVAGDTQCNGAVIESCNVGALGCLEWTPGTDCGVGGDVCSAASGTAACVPCSSSCTTVGDTQCALVFTDTNTPALAIPDAAGAATTCGGGTPVTDIVTTTRTDAITDVDVTINMTTTFTGDLDIFLGFLDDAGVSHCVELTTDNGGGADNFTGTVFDDEAAAAITSIAAAGAPFTGSYKPEGLLSSLDGLPMNGTWTLYAADDAFGRSRDLRQLDSEGELR